MSYEGLMDDPNLTTKEKIINLQRAIDNVTRRKIQFASLQGELLQRCFDQSKKDYEKTLKEVGIKKRWALFLRKLYKLILEYNQLAYCIVSLRFVHCNFNGDRGDL